MPKLTANPLEEKRRVVRAYISKNMEMYGIKEAEIAKALDITTRTLQNKRKRPETFTMQELWSLSRKLKLNDQEKAEMI